MSGPNLPRATKPHRRVANCPPPSHQTPPPSRQCPPPRHQTPPPSRQIPPLRRQRPRHHSRTGPVLFLVFTFLPETYFAQPTIFCPDPIPLAAGCLSSVLLTNHTWRTAVLRPDLPHWSRCKKVMFMALAPLNPYAEADLSVTTLPPLCRRKRG